MRGGRRSGNGCAIALAATLLLAGACGSARHPRVEASGICNQAERAWDRTPADLDEAHERLARMLSPRVTAQLRDGSDEDLSKYHHSLGLRLRNTWGLWGGSRLARWFCGIGIHHPDDMSGIVLSTFRRKLRGEPLALEAEVASSQAWWDCAAASPAMTFDPAAPDKTRMTGLRSPRDGAPIDWIIHDGGCPEGRVSLGVSDSDGSFWRFAHAAGARVQPARPDERARLAEEVAKARDARAEQAFEACASTAGPPIGFQRCPACFKACVAAGIVPEDTCRVWQQYRCKPYTPPPRPPVPPAPTGEPEDSR